MATGMHENPIMLWDIPKAVLEIQFDFSTNVAQNGERIVPNHLCATAGPENVGFDVGLEAGNESPVQGKDAARYDSGNDSDDLRLCS